MDGQTDPIPTSAGAPIPETTDLRAPRHRPVPVQIGDVTVGGEAPVLVQSMTNTDTADAASTAAQVAELYRAGSELVRITVNNKEAAAAPTMPAPTMASSYWLLTGFLPWPGGVCVHESPWP